jgi:hypothetical protein
MREISRAFYYEELLSIDQLPQPPFFGKDIGIYKRVPRCNVGVLQRKYEVVMANALGVA